MRIVTTRIGWDGPRIGSKLLAASVAMLLGLAATTAQAASKTDELSDLRQRLDAQERQIEDLQRRLEQRDSAAAAAADSNAQLESQQQQLKVLERKLELNDETAKSAAATAPVVKAGPKGFSIQSADGANVVKLRGALHYDGRYFLDDTAPDSANSWLLRRVRPTLEGTLGGIFDFRFTPDFAGGKTIILDAFGAIRFAPWAQLTAGKFKVPVGLERLVSSNDLKFIERGLPTVLVPNRDLGIALGGDLNGGTINYSVGVYNGVVDGGSSDAQGDVETNGDRDWAARVFFQPFLNSEHFALRGLGFGIAGTYVNGTGNPLSSGLPSYRTPDQQSFFKFRGDNAATAGLNEATYLDGRRVRLAPQAYYYHGSFGALAEYVRVSQDISRTTAAGLRSSRLDTSAWQLALSYFLTGEEASYKGLKPNSTFNLGKPGWGAFEIVARYNELRLDEGFFSGGALSFADPLTQPRKVTEYAIGLNWYFNQNVKWQINYENAKFDGGGGLGRDRGDGESILTRLAVGF